MLINCETYLIDIAKENRKGIISSVIKGLLWLLSLGYKFGASLYHLGFNLGWRRRYYPPVPVVVSVGNIVAGGTGKTPVIIMLAKEFSQKYSTAILTRGYRSPAEKLSTPVALSLGRGPLYPSSYCGDEPYMISENVPDASLYVGRNRKKASMIAAKSGARLILLDDGMQYRQLARDIEIVVFNASDPFGLGYFLPRGSLRESVHGLNRANLIIINHAYDQEQYLAAKQQISQYSRAPVVAMKPQMIAIRSMNGNHEYSIHKKKIGLLCAIGAPETFRKLLQSECASIVAENILPDHAAFNQKALENFAYICAQRGAEFLVCTEKDKVKISEHLELALPVLWAQIDLEIVEGKEHWDHLIHALTLQLDKMPILQGG